VATAFGKVQRGAESVAGTAVAATARLMGEYTAEWDDQTVIDLQETMRGDLNAYHIGDDEKLAVAAVAKLDGTLLFEDFVYWLLGGVAGNVTPTADSGTPTPAQTWVFEHNQNAPDPITPAGVATYEFGDDTLCEEMEYGLVRNFEFFWGVQERTKLTVNLFGRQLSPSAFTVLASPQRDVEGVAGQAWKVFLDDVGGTIGTTEYPGCLRGGTFSSGDLWLPFHCANGQLYFKTHIRPKLKPQVKLKVAVDSSLAAYRAKFRAKTRQLVRLENTGSEIHAGATPASKKITLDMAGVITGISAIGSAVEEQVYTEELTLMGAYDPTWGHMWKTTVVNALSAMP